jgi:hypothetical protein
LVTVGQAFQPDRFVRLESLTYQEKPSQTVQPHRYLMPQPETARPTLPPIPASDPHTVDQLPAPDSLPPEPGKPAVEEALPRPDIPGYEILDILGRGGMGVVYQARQTQLDRLVALKMILVGGHAGPDELTRFRTEAEAIGRLQHPNIVQIYEVGQHNGLPFLCLEFCPGGSLAQKLDGTPLPPAEAARLVETLARAIEAAHQKQIVHRDLTPGNVLLAADGQLKVTDFGLAKKLDAAAQTRSGAIMGTPSYMAPEQAGGKLRQIGPATDVYALGAILYELLTGRPPFRAATSLDTILQVVAEEPVPPTQLQPKTPRDLETICLKCLQKEPARRYGTAQALADDLGRFQRNEPIAARPVGSLERLAKWARRQPAVATLLAAVLVLLIAGISVSTFFALDASEQAEDARAKAKIADDKTKLAEKKSDELNVALAQSLLRPMGHEGSAVGSIELDALWELASTANDRLRLLFIEKALEKPATAEQLNRRAHLAVHAVVGLNPDRRQQVLQMLVSKLRDKGTDLKIRLACVSLGNALQENTEEYCGYAASTILEQMAKTSDPPALANLARALKAVGDKLSPPQASTAAQQLLQEMARNNDPRALDSLTKALQAVAQRLSPDQVSMLAQPLLQQITKTAKPGDLIQQIITKTTKRDDLNRLTAPLKAMAGRMSPHQASTTAQQLLQEMAKTPFPNDLDLLADTFKVVADKLSPDHAATVAQQLLQQITKTSDPDTLYIIHFVSGFQAVASKLNPDQAATVAQQLLPQMAKTTNARALNFLAQALKAVADKMNPDQASKVATTATEQLLQQMTKATERIGKDTQTYDLLDLAWTFQAVVKLRPKQPSKMASTLAQQLLQRMGTTNDPSDLADLALTAEAAVSTLSPDQATSMAPTAAQQLLQQMARTHDSRALGSLASALQVVADGLSPEQAHKVAATAAQLLRERMAKTIHSFDFIGLAQTFQLVVKKLNPEQASKEAAKVAQLLGERMGKAINPVDVDNLARALEKVAGKLSSDQAAKAAQQLLQEMTKTTTYPYALANLAGAFKAVADRMSPDHAATAAPQLLQQMARITDPSALATLVDPLKPLIDKLSPEQASKTASTAAQQFLQQMTRATTPTTLTNLAVASKAVADRLSPDQASKIAQVLLERIAKIADPTTAAIDSLSPAAAQALAEGMRSLASKLSQQEVVNLLKSPLCVGRARESLLLHLGQQHQRTFRDLWEFVEWARVNEPNLDLTSPPNRPTP